MNGKNVSLENHTHNYDDKYALKGHNHDDKYALKDHTHSDIETLESKIKELQISLELCQWFSYEWNEDNKTYYNENSVFDIYLGYHIALFKLKDKYKGGQVVLTIIEGTTDDDWVLKYANNDFGTDIAYEGKTRGNFSQCLNFWTNCSFCLYYFDDRTFSFTVKLIKYGHLNTYYLNIRQNSNVTAYDSRYF